MLLLAVMLPAPRFMNPLIPDSCGIGSIANPAAARKRPETVNTDRKREIRFTALLLFWGGCPGDSSKLPDQVNDKK